MASEPSASQRALAAFVAEHRPALEEHATSDAEAARITEAVLAWNDVDETINGVGER